MEQFLNEIYTIHNINTLQNLKQELKDQVTSPLLSWQDRMVLYRKIQIINEYILQLSTVKITT